MASKSDTGHAKNIANLKLFNTGALALGPLYQPNNSDLYLTDLQTMYELSAAAQSKVNAALPPYTTAVARRDGIFNPFLLELTKIRRAVIATKGITPQQIAGLMTIIRKYRGVRKVPKPKTEDPEELAKYHSVSQTSFDLRTNTLDMLIAYLINLPNYEPNEDNVKVATLENTKQQMLSATDEVNTTFISLNAARSGRNLLLYFASKNLFKAGTDARNYVLGILNKTQSEYKFFSKIIFKKIVSRTR